MIAATPPPPPPPPPDPAASFVVRSSSVTPRRAFFGAARKVSIRARFTASGPIDLSVQVRRRGGPLVRTLRIGNARPGVLRARWNGLTRNGRAARDGAYRISVRPAAGGRPVRLGTVVLRGHVYPLRGAHSFRGPIGLFGAPRSGGRVHEGADVLASCGTPVLAARAGRVKVRRYDPVLYGHYVIVRGARERRDYWYVHLRSPGRVPVGRRVRTGQRLGAVGASGNARTQGCQLHFELRGPRGPFDPLPALRRWDSWS